MLPLAAGSRLAVTARSLGKDNFDIRLKQLKGNRWSLTLALLTVLAAFVLVVPITLVHAATPVNQQAHLKASDAATNDSFGMSVALSGDTTVVGADGESSYAGAAYVFVASGVNWSEQQKLTASDAAAFDEFGISVAISGDTAVIGAHLEGPSFSESGAAYVFVRSGGVWSEQQKLTASDTAPGDTFGISVAISGDTVVVGADQDDSLTGSAYVFVRSGATWSEQQKLTTSDAATTDQFGHSVAISGETAVIGADLNDDVVSNSGSAYVFIRSGTTWSEQQKLTAGDAASGDRFGWAVAISGDTAAVGAIGNSDAGVNSGSAYIFVRSGVTWTEQQKLTASDAAASDRFSWSVAVSGDTAVIGASEDDDLGAQSGSAYVFARSGVTWSEETKLTASDGAASDKFGKSVAISGATAVIGASTHDDGSANSGAAYVFGQPALPVPAIGAWGLSALALVLGAFVIVTRRRRNNSQFRQHVHA